MKKNIWLLLILLTAFIVRVWGIRFCLPFRYGHIDESVVIFYTMRFFGGNFNPSPFFDYPSLHLYSLFIIYFFYMIFGGFSAESLIELFMSNPTSIYMLGRFFTVLLGVGTVYLTYLLAKRMFNKKTGLLAGLFICLNWGHVLHSHYATVDIPSLFYVMLAVYFMCKILEDNSIRNYIIAGLLLGLAAAVKYYGFIFFINVIIAHWFYNRSKSLKITAKWHYLLICLFFMLAGFLIGFPYSVLDVSGFAGRFVDRFQLIIGTGGAQGRNLFSYGWFRYPGIILNSIGWFSFVVFLAGAIMVIMKRRKKDVFLLSFIIIYYLFSGSWKVATDRYVLPLYPFFAIIGARFIIWLTGKLRDETARRYSLRAVVIVLLVTTLPGIIKMDYILSKKDTRLIAYEWFVKNIPVKSRVLREPFTPEFTRGEDYRVKVDWDEDIREKSIEELSGEYDYVLVSNFDYESECDFEVRLNKKAGMVKEFKGKRIGTFHNPRIRVYKLGS